MDGDYCSLDFIRFLLDVRISYFFLTRANFVLWQNGADPTIKNNLGQSVRDFMPNIGTLSSSESFAFDERTIFTNYVIIFRCEQI